jgi:16S rRNA (uracil1498-N3)-methyltransferase
MKLHRFYVTPDVRLTHDFWLHDETLLHQWNNVLRFRPDQQVVLFDGIAHERLYTISELSSTEAHLRLVTDMIPKKPSVDIYLLWASLKKDKNDWVLQKCTELGVGHFIPILTERSEKTGFRVDRAKKIVIEASEQCGRGDIPDVREPLTLETALTELKDKVQLLICEQANDTQAKPDKTKSIGLLVGPEGGWSDSERELFAKHQISHIDLHQFTLRAETAAVAAVTMVAR